MSDLGSPTDGQHHHRSNDTGRPLGEVMATWDWSQSPVGDPSQWAPTLQTMVRVLLGSRFSMWMGWGDQLAFFYNDAYRVDTLGVKHPWALGRPAHEVWEEIWDEIAPRIESVLSTGEATWDEDLLLFLERSGYREETYHTFSYSPIADAQDHVTGLLCVVSEETERVISERRLTALRDLSTALATAQDESQVFAAVERGLAACPQDLPFALVYRADDDGYGRLAASSGVELGDPVAPQVIELDAPAVWPLRTESRGGLELVDLDGSGPPLPTSVWDDPPTTAVVVPLAQPAQPGAVGYLVAGLNPYRPVDETYLGFVGLFGGQVAAAVANVRALESERQRSAALAELDRAKTEFFSNVSHELRTPLTLIAGPARDSLADRDEPLGPHQRDRLELIDRNANRLHRLVNDLLDFASIEAGAIQPLRQPVDLSVLTRDIVASFAAAVEQADLELVVDCPPATHAVNVDVEMWTKITLNLLSNALKFTLEGTISVSLRQDVDEAVLTVTDTGVGIPPDQVPLLFQRFHRVPAAGGRSHEGTGVGLALVAELAELHGGSASASSVEGGGSTFTVAIPTGEADVDSTDTGDRGEARDARIDEALSWTTSSSPGTPAAESASCVLVVEDNPDLRDYITRTLAPFWRIRVAGDGLEALDAVRSEPPDLVLSDVMMPSLDGFELLAALRGTASTATIPVILLSARAGEEASVEGLRAGADDYLVKPFSSIDLVARVRSNLELARFRNEESARRRALVESLDEAVIVADSSGTVLEANPAFGRLLGYDQLATPYPAPHPWWPTAEEDPDARAAIDEAAGRALAGQRGRVTVRLRHADGRRMFVDASFAPLSEHENTQVVVSLRDVTADVVAADRQSVVARLGIELAGATDRRAVARAAVTEIRPLFGASAAAVLLGGLDEPVVLASDHPGQPERSPAQWADAIAHEPRSGSGAATDARHALVSTVSDGEERATVWLQLDPPRPVGDDELALFHLVCEHVSQALHRARLFDEQAEVATAMQRSILGPTRTPAGVAVRYVPAVQPLEVGGDWYDLIEVDDDTFGIIVGDCVGKGLEAATVMGQLRSAARALFLPDPSPAAVLAALDAFARQVPGAECTTAICAVVHRETGAVRYASAGHVPGVVAHPDGSTILLDDVQSPPLASLHNRRTEGEVQMQPGSVLLFCTDGLIERRGEHLGIGLARLRAAAAEARTAPPEAIAQRILTDLVPGGQQRDDVALVVYAPRPPAELTISIDADPQQLRVLRHALAGWLDDLGVPEADANDVLLAVGEAAANAVEHAYGRDRPGRAHLAAAADGHRITVEVRDEGAWLAPSGDDITRGRGILIMRSVMDEVDVATTRSGTVVTMSKQVPMGSSSGGN